jgi:protocatechuate 3,4-dioxygenase alpha subunit
MRTRLYFDGEPLNDTDPVLALILAGRRHTVSARRAADDAYEFNIVLQGEGETVFLEA